MKPFGQLVAERAADPERCIRECAAFMKRMNGISAGKLVSLDQVVPLAALVYLGLEEASKVQTKEGNVVMIVADSSLEARDGAA